MQSSPHIALDDTKDAKQFYKIFQTLLGLERALMAFSSSSPNNNTMQNLLDFSNCDQEKQTVCFWVRKMNEWKHQISLLN